MTFANGRVAIIVAATALAACGGQAAINPSPTPSLTVGTVFNLQPVEGAHGAGTITVFPGMSSTTIELKISGLLPDSSHVSHIHVGSCAARGAIKFALNQVIANGQGQSDTRTTLEVKFPPTGERWYVVVHAGPDMQGASSQYLLCGNLFF